MPGNVIDSLTININANANRAIANLDRLQSSLKNTARAIDGFGSSANNLGNWGNMGKGGGKSSGNEVSTLKTRFVELGRAGKAAMNGISSAYRSAGSVVRRITSKMTSNIGLLNRSMRGTSLIAASVRTALGTIIGIRGITGAFDWLKEAVTLGGDITEIDHIVESVFAKDMVGYVDTWSKSAIEDFGIAEAKAKEYAGTLSAMFQSSGVDVRDAGKMSMDLVGLAGDLSAFYNEDTAVSYEKIKSGLAGMVRPLRAYGIDLTAATLEEYRLAQGIQKSYSEMTQAEKVMLRYNYLMANTKTQQGDFARTSQSLANAMRTLRAYAEAVQTQIGVGLASAIRHVVVWLNTLMKYLLKAATAFATFMQTIFGKYKGGASGIALEDLGDSVGYADDLGDAANSAAGGLGNASDAAKQLKKDLSVLPFDELNQLNKDHDTSTSGTGGGSGGSGGGGGGIGDLLDWGLDMDDSPLGKLPDWFSKWAKAMKDAVKLGDFDKLGEIIADGLNKGIDKLYEVLNPEKAKAKIYPYIDAFTTTFNSAVDNLHWEKLGRTVGEGINIVVGSLNRLIEGIDWKNLGRKFAEGANGLVDEVDFHDVGRLIGNKFMVVWNVLNGFVHDFKWDRLGVQIGNLINGLFERVSFSTIADTLATGLNGLFEALKNEAETIHWGDIADNISDGIITFIEETNWEENGASLNLFLTNLCDAIIRAVDGVGSEKWEELGQGIADTLAGLPWGKILKTVGHVIVTALGGILKGLFSEPEGIIAAAVITGLGLLRFKESAFGLFIRHIVKAITGKSCLELLTSGFKKLFQKSVTDASTSKEVSTAAETAAKTITKSFNSGTAADALFGGSRLKAGIMGTLTPLANIGSLFEHSKSMDKIIEPMVSVRDAVEDANLSYDDMNKLIDLASQKSTAWGFAVESASSNAKTNLDYVVQSGKDTDETFGYIAANLQRGLGLTEEEFIGLVNQVASGSTSMATNYGFVGTAVSAATATVKSKLSEQIAKLRENATEYTTSWTNANSWKDKVSAAMQFAGTSVSDFTKYAKVNMLDSKISLQDTGAETGRFKNSTSQNLGASGGIVNDLATKIKNMAVGSIAQYGALNKSSTTHLQGINKQTQNTIQETGKMTPAMEKTANNTSSVFGKGILAMVAHVVNLGVKLASATAAITKALGVEGKRAGESYVSGITAGFSTVERAIQNLNWKLQNGLSANLYEVGRQAGQTFASGLESVYIRTPHLYISNWNVIYYGVDGYSFYPSFGVSWYKKGGLFQGGNGQMIGIAEDGRDEAVLPLEDHRAMARIGSAIADASGSSVDNDSMLDRVANKIVEAILTNQAQQQSPIFNITVKTESDEVLARAVTRGQRQLDYRNNPTPSFA